MKIVDTGLVVGVPGVTSYKKYRFTQSMKLAKRIYPHVHNMDGFFICKLRKYANGEKKKAYDLETEPVREDADKKRKNPDEKKKKKKARKAKKAKAEEKKEVAEQEEKSEEIEGGKIEGREALKDVEEEKGIYSY